MIDLKDDISLAVNVRQRAYVPYSHYKVGAVLTCKNGKKYTGCNVENGGIQSICAELQQMAHKLNDKELTQLTKKLIEWGINYAARNK